MDGSEGVPMTEYGEEKPRPELMCEPPRRWQQRGKRRQAGESGYSGNATMEELQISGQIESMISVEPEGVPMIPIEIEEEPKKPIEAEPTITIDFEEEPTIELEAEPTIPEAPTDIISEPPAAPRPDPIGELGPFFILYIFLSVYYPLLFSCFRFFYVLFFFSFPHILITNGPS